MIIYSYKKFKNVKVISWYKVHKKIFKLQTRIAKQLKKKNFRKVRDLQRLILKSFGTRLLASQKLISTRDINKFNRYKKNTNNLFLDSLNLNNFIQIQNYNQHKNRIEHSNDFSKLLHFQCLQFLWVLALLPINETLSEPFSYNCRLYRTQVDILRELYYIFNFTHYNWLVILKPIGFFKSRNEKWLFKNSFLERKFLNFIINNERLANSYTKKKKEIIETRGINLIKLIKSSCYYSFTEFKRQYLLKIISYESNRSKLTGLPILFYSDLILIPGEHLIHLKKTYRLIFSFLNQRGLIIQKNRFWVINLLSGFNFLGWSIKKKGGRVLITISRENVKSHQIEIKKLLKSARFLPIDKVIVRLNKKIIKWQSYYSYTPYLYKVWSEMNNYLFRQVWRWCRKRHKNKGTKWLYNRYWYYNKRNKWVFHTNMHYLKKYNLKRMKIISLPGSINIFESKNWEINRNILLMRIDNARRS